MVQYRRIEQALATPKGKTGCCRRIRVRLCSGGLLLACMSKTAVQHNRVMDLSGAMLDSRLPITLLTALSAPVGFCLHS